MGPMPLGEGKAEKQFVEIAKAFMRRQVKNCLSGRGHKFRQMEERALERKLC